MEIKLGVGVLRSVLSRALGVAGGRGTSMPILSTVLLEAEVTPEGGRLKATAYDLEIGVVSEVPVEVAKPGSAAVPVKLLADVAKALPGGVVEIKAEANRRLVLTANASSFRLAGLDPADFPGLPTTSPKAKWAPVNREELVAVLDRVSYAISTDETRYALNGVLFEAADDWLTLVATDGHRLAVDRLAVTSRYGLTGDGAIVPSKAVAELRQLLTETSTEPGDLAFAEGSILYRRPGLAFTARLVDGQFPAWSQVVPAADPKAARLTIDRVALRDVLRRVLLLAEDKASAVTLALADGELTVSARSAEAGEATDRVPVEYAGPALSVTCNGHYLADVAGAETSFRLALQVGDEVSPLVWTPAAGGEARHVVMPMRR